MLGPVRPAPGAAIPEERLTPWQRVARAEDARVLGDGTLARALADADAGLRRRAALAVGRLQDSLGTALLLPLLGDPDAEVRREAVFALGQIGLAHPAGPGRPAAARKAIETLAADADPATAELALEALGKLGDRAATPFVVARLGHPEAALRGAYVSDAAGIIERFFQERTIAALSVGPADFRAALELATAAAGARA